MKKTKWTGVWCWWLYRRPRLRGPIVFSFWIRKQTIHIPDIAIQKKAHFHPRNLEENPKYISNRQYVNCIPQSICTSFFINRIHLSQYWLCNNTFRKPTETISINWLVTTILVWTSWLQSTWSRIYFQWKSIKNPKSLVSLLHVTDNRIHQRIVRMDNVKQDLCKDKAARLNAATSMYESCIPQERKCREMDHGAGTINPRSKKNVGHLEHERV